MVDGIKEYYALKARTMLLVSDCGGVPDEHKVAEYLCEAFDMRLGEESKINRPPDVEVKVADGKIAGDALRDGPIV
jgi:hypothetical protein